MENWLSQVGTATKHFAERYGDYPAPAHAQQVYYAYDPPSSSQAHAHVAASKHQYGGGHKSNAAMSALTLLAFLFFLHILQQCLKEHMTAMSTPQVMVVSAGRAGERVAAKTSPADKLDKGGLVQDVAALPRVQLKHKGGESTNPNFSTDDNFLTRIATAEHTPQGRHIYKNISANFTDRSSIFGGFVSAMGGK